jgi:hypothetical protein
MPSREICEAKIALNIPVTTVVDLDESRLLDDSFFRIVGATSAECVLTKDETVNGKIRLKPTFV